MKTLEEHREDIAFLDKRGDALNRFSYIAIIVIIIGFISWFGYIFTRNIICQLLLAVAIGFAFPAAINAFLNDINEMKTLRKKLHDAFEEYEKVVLVSKKFDN